MVEIRYIDARGAGCSVYSSDPGKVVRVLKRLRSDAVVLAAGGSIVGRRDGKQWWLDAEAMRQEVR